VTSAKAPTERNDWMNLRMKEATAFKQLCSYLLGQKRVDLLIQAVDMRHPTDELSQSYSKHIMMAASSLDLPQIQLLKCLIRCGGGKMVLSYNFQSIYLPASHTPKRSIILPPRRRFKINLCQKISLRAVLSSFGSMPINFFDMEPLKLTICKHAIRRLFLFDNLRYGNQLHRSCRMGNTYSFSPAKTNYKKPLLTLGKECPGCLRWIKCMRDVELCLYQIDLSQSGHSQVNLFLDLLKSLIPWDFEKNFGDEPLLLCLYLENIFRRENCPTLRHGDLYDAILDVYEYWFLPLVVNLGYSNRNFISVLCNKLVSIAGLALYAGNSKHSTRKLASRCLYYLGKYAQCQHSVTKRDETFKIALVIATQSVDAVSKERKSPYDTFEIATLALWIHGHCRTQESLPTKLREHIKRPAYVREDENIDTEFPAIRQSYLRAPFDIAPGYPIRPASIFYRFEIRGAAAGAAFPDNAEMNMVYSSLQLDSFEQAVLQIDSTIANTRSYHPNYDLQWLSQAGFGQSLDSQSDASSSIYLEWFDSNGDVFDPRFSHRGPIQLQEPRSLSNRAKSFVNTLLLGP
jgi:hypothetical protein